MPPLLRALLTDLKAAALIGLPDTVYTALEALRGLPEADLPTSALLPLGRALTPLPADELRSLAQDADPVIRALAAAALGEQFALGKNITPADLTVPASDPSPEVRLTLAGGLTGVHGGAAPSKDFLPLADRWLATTTPALLHTGLLLLPHTHPAPEKLTALLTPLHTLAEHDLRDTLLETLTALAQTGHTGTLLNLLDHWAAQPDPNIWLITRALSANWASGHSPQAIAILQKLADNAGPLRAVRRAMERHKRNE